MVAIDARKRFKNYQKIFNYFQIVQKINYLAIPYFNTPIGIVFDSLQQMVSIKEFLYESLTVDFVK